MQRQVVVRVWFGFALVVLMVGTSIGMLGSGAVAQSDPAGTPSSAGELQTQVAEQQATIEALQTQVADLKQRISELSGPKAAPTSAAAGGTTLKVNETFTNESWAITVTGYEISPTVDSSYEQNVARGVYCIVYFTVTNVGNSPVEFPYMDLQLSDSEGRSYGPDSDALFNLVYVIFESGAPYEPLQPGLPYTTAIAFDIPADATGLTFTSENRAFTFSLDQ
jgi:hypothetical protein